MLALAGCGAADRVPPGSLSELAPADSDLYLEAVLKPDFDARGAIKAVTDRFPQAREIGTAIANRVDSRLGRLAGARNQPLSFGRDIEPWLGDRFSVAVKELEGGGLGYSVALETSDPDEAESAIERLVASSALPVREQDVDGRTAYAFADGLCLGMVGDRVVLASGAARFAEVAALGAADAGGPGNPRPLAARQDFSYSVGTAEGSRAIVFSWLDSAAVIDAAARQLDRPALASRFDIFAREAGIDDSKPASFALGVTSDVVLFDTSLSLLDREVPDPSADALLLGSLPAQSLAAVSCSTCLDLLFSKSASSLLSSVDPDPTDLEALRRLQQRAGGLRRAIGVGAAYVYAPTPTSLAGAVAIEVRDPVAVGGALARLREATGELQGVRVTPVRIRGARAEGFIVQGERLSAPLLVAANDTRLVVALGRDAARQALAPDVTLGDVRAFSDFSDQLGDEFSPSSLVDVARIRGLLAIDRDPEVQRLLRLISPINRAGSGTRIADGQLITRLDTPYTAWL